MSPQCASLVQGVFDRVNSLLSSEEGTLAHTIVAQPVKIANVRLVLPKKLFSQAAPELASESAGIYRI